MAGTRPGSRRRLHDGGKTDVVVRGASQPVATGYLCSAPPLLRGSWLDSGGLYAVWLDAVWLDAVWLDAVWLDGDEVGADRVAVAGQAVDALLDPADLAPQQSGGLRGQAVGVEMDLVRLAEKGQDVTDDLGGEAGVEQPADLLQPVDRRLAVGTVAVAGPLGMQQVLLLVVAQHRGGDAGAPGQLADLHGAPRARGRGGCGERLDAPPGPGDENSFAFTLM